MGCVRPWSTSVKSWPFQYGVPVQYLACRVQACITQPRFRMMMYCAWSWSFWPSSMGDTGIEKSPSYCGSEAGTLITRKLSVYGAKKSWKSQSDTKRRRPYDKGSSVIRLRPTHRRQIWAINFVRDKPSNGRSYKMLTFLDEYTCQALCVEVRDKMNSDDVIEVIQRLLLIY